MPALGLHFNFSLQFQFNFICRPYDWVTSTLRKVIYGHETAYT